MSSEGWLEFVEQERSDELETKFRARAEMLERAIREGDVEVILRLFIGKGLYAELRNQLHDVTLPVAIQKYNEIRNVPDFQKIVAGMDMISDFKTRIGAYLA